MAKKKKQPNARHQPLPETPLEATLNGKPRCQARVKRSGRQCKMFYSLKNGICWIHRKDLGSRRPLRHEARCEVCRDPRRQEIEARYTAWDLTAVDLAQRYGYAVYTMQRHIRYYDLTIARAENLLPFIGKAMELGLGAGAATATLRDGIMAASLAWKVSGGLQQMLEAIVEKQRTEIIGGLIPILEKAGVTPEQLAHTADLLEKWSTAEEDDIDDASDPGRIH